MAVCYLPKRNCSSCLLPLSFNFRSKSSAQTAKLLDTEGNVIGKLKLPVETAEVMIAEPGFVVVSVNEVRRTRRLLALPADVDLLPGKAYLLVPTGRALSWASESEMEIAHQWAFENRNNNKKKKKKNSSDPPKKSSGSGSRVSPAVSVSDADNGEVEVEEEVPREVAITFTGTGTAGRLSASLRRWNPALEPILESH